MKMSGEQFFVNRLCWRVITRLKNKGLPEYSTPIANNKLEVCIRCFNGENDTKRLAITG
jgi:hypothetical protein